MLNYYFSKLFQFLPHDLYFFLSLFFLITLTFIHFWQINEEKKTKIYFYLFLLIVLIFIFWSTFLTFKQYFIWQNHPLSRYLLPPYQKINYFLSYASFTFWRDLVFRLFSVLFIYLFLKFLNFVFRGKIFYKEEEILVPLLAIFYFFPYNLLFVSLAFFVLLLLMIKELLKGRWSKKERFSFRNYWLFLAWVIFLFQPLILTNYQFLKFKP